MDSLRPVFARPLPPDVAIGEFGTGFFYEKYSAFSWAWSWRRTLLFASIAVPYGALLGVVHGLFAHSFGEGMAVSWRAGLAGLLMVGCGPWLAAAARHRLAPARIERSLVVASVAAGVLLAIAAREYVEAFHDRLMGESVVGLARFARLFSGELPAHGLVERSADIAATLALYAVAGGVLGLRAYFSEPRRWREHEQRLAVDALRREKLEAEQALALLQAQVEPHFLFNTLASVRSLIQTEPQRAAEMIDAVADYLRSTLPRLREASGASASTLAEQFEICRAYLALMDLRLSGRLAVTADLPPALADVPFPPLLLLSLVENAVEHGVEPKVGRVRIELAARQTDSGGAAELEVSVCDDGAGLREGLAEGTGLANVRGQLDLLFGADARLEIESRPSGGVRASIHIAWDRLTS